MAILPHLNLTDIPQHSWHCGDKRIGSFLDDGDRKRYLHLLREVSLATRVQLHVFVLMTAAHAFSIEAPTD